MSVEKRPYVGTWKLNNKQVYQHAPDCLVYINGDVTIPNAINVNRQPARINFQKYITQVSVDAGTQPGSASSSISLSIPAHSNESFVRDAEFILRPGLEVHVYMRGYFPARGMFSRDEEQLNTDGLFTEPPVDSTENKGYDNGNGPRKANGEPYTRKDLLEKSVIDRMIKQGWIDPKSPKEFPYNLTPKFFSDPDKQVKNAKGELVTVYGNHTRLGDQNTPEKIANNMDTLLAGWKTTQQYLEQLGYTQVTMGSDEAFSPYGHTANTKTSAHIQGWGCDPVVTAIPPGGNKVQKINALDLYEINLNLRASGKLSGDHVAHGGLGVYLKAGTTPQGALDIDNWSDKKGHYDMGGERNWVWAGGYPLTTHPQKGNPLPPTDPSPWLAALKGDAKKRFPKPNDTVSNYKQNLPNAALDANTAAAPPPPTNKDGKSDRVTPVAGEGTVNGLGGERGGVPLDDIIAYPYYHVFHGVVTQADLSYNGGFQSATLNCSSLLHFWQFHQLASSASYFGTRPSNSKLQLSLTGHPFTGKHPYEIMYTLFHDTAGAAGGVGFALSQKTNQRAAVGGESLWSLNIKYWEKRFSSGRMMKLRLYGASGTLFNSLQSAFLGRLTTGQLNDLTRNRFPNSAVQNTVAVFNSAQQLGLVGNQKIRKAANALGAASNAANNTTLQAAQTAVASVIVGEESAAGAGAFSLTDMQAFVKDLGTFGEVNLFETNYQTKLDIANEVTKVTGFEFFQDVDGDFVFKPPFYNMDSSTSRIYRIEDIDLISISISEKEPNVTYSIGKGSHFKNTIGTGVDGEWGVDGRYVDWRLVAQFGWRQDSFEAMYFTDPRSLFFAAVNRIDLANVESSSASVTIPLRPEIRVGYPFYIVGYDTYYYCNSFSHSWQAGSQCTTSLQLVAKRTKFYPPGNPNGHGVSKVDLSDTTAPPVTLEVVDSQGQLKLAGFPNVVMTLDPTQVNPLFFFTQGQLTNLTNPAALGAVIKIAVDKKLIVPDPDNLDNPNAFVFDVGEKFKGQKFFINPDDTIPKSKQGAYVTLTNAAKNKDTAIDNALQANNKAKKKELGGLLAKKDSLTGKLETLNAKLRDAKTKDAEVDKIQAQIDKLNQDLRENQQNYDAAAERLNQNLEQVTQSFPKDVQLLTELLNLVGEKVLKDKEDIWKGANNTAILLELLADKKASFNNNGTPGSYRYFSCSHPDPSQQGIAFQFNGFGAEVDENGSRLPTPMRTNGFTPTEKIPRPADPKAAKPEAELKEQDGFVKRGIWIQRPGAFKLSDGRSSQKFGRSFRVLLSTQEIQSLEFSITQTPNKIDKSSAKTSIVPADFTQPLTRGLVNYLNIQLGGAPPAAAESGEALVQAVLGQFQTVATTLENVYSVQPTAIHVDLNNLTKPPPAPKVAKSKDVTKLIADLETQLAAQKARLTALASSDSRVSNSKKAEERDFIESRISVLNKRIAALKASAAKAKATPTPPKGPNPTPVSKFAANYVPKQTPVSQVYEPMAAAFAGLIQSSFATQYQNLVTELTKQKKSQDEIDLFMRKKYVEPCAATINDFYVNQCKQTDGAFDKQPLTTKQVSTAKDAVNTVYSPVFPVSDENGYRVVGSYRYGRGIKMMPDNLLDQLTAADPKSVLSQKTLEQLVSATTGSEAKKTEALKKAVGELSTVYSKNQIRDLGLLDANGNISSNAFSNFVADSRDSTQQIPATNAAFTLADLGVSDDSGGGATSTRAAEADVLLQAFSLDFVNVVRTGDYANIKAVNDMLQSMTLGPDGQPTLDPASAYQAYVMASNSVEWQQRQDDLRGTRPITSTTTGQQAYDAAKTLGKLF